MTVRLYIDELFLLDNQAICGADLVVMPIEFMERLG